MSKPTLTYAHWREDKEQETGYSKELISDDLEFYFKHIKKTTPDYDIEEIPHHMGFKTVIDALDYRVKTMPKNDWLGVRDGKKFNWISFTEGQDRIMKLSHGIMAFDLAPEIEAEDRKWRFMGYMAKNRIEFELMHLAGMYQNITSVPLYETLGMDAIKYIVDQCKLTSAAISKANIEKFTNLKKSDPVMMESLKNLVVFDSDLTDEEKSMIEGAGLSLHTYQQLYDKGTEMMKNGEGTLNKPHEDDCFVFSYTSGTTGNPKGVKLTHKMIIQAD